MSFLNITDFELPDEDFGPLKLKKLKSYSEKLIESPDSKTFGKRLSMEGNCATLEAPQIDSEVEDLEEELTAPSEAHRPGPTLKRQPMSKGLSSSAVLFTPTDIAAPNHSGRSTASAYLCSPAFPILGTTPAFASQATGENVTVEVGQTCSTSLPSHLGDTNSLANSNNQCNSSVSSPKLDNLHVSGRQGQPTCVSEPGPQATPLPNESFTFRENQLCGNACLELHEHSIEQVQSFPL